MAQQVLPLHGQVTSVSFPAHRHRPRFPSPLEMGWKEERCNLLGQWSPLNRAVPVPTHTPPAPGAARPPMLPATRPAPAPLGGFPPAGPDTLPKSTRFGVISQPGSYRAPQVSSTLQPPPSSSPSPPPLPIALVSAPLPAQHPSQEQHGRCSQPSPYPSPGPTSSAGESDVV